MLRWLMVALTSCLLINCGAHAEPTPDAVATQVAVEMAAHSTMTAQAPTATSTPLPTNTPSPTDTPTATKTPLPTNTPRPTPTRDSSAEIQLWIADMKDKKSTLVAALNDLTELMQNAEPSDSDWVDDCVEQAEIVKRTHLELVAADAPEEVAEIREVLVARV